MRVALLCTPSTSYTADWVAAALSDRGHDLVPAPAGPGVLTVSHADRAGEVGHALADHWARRVAPDVVLALGWEAGLAAHVGARTSAVPVVLRLTRAARSPGTDRHRLESALARGSRRVLVPSVGELDRLVDHGVRRAALRVLPEAVDHARFVDRGAELPGGTPHRVAVASSELSRALPAYRPVVLPATAGEDELAEALRSVHAFVVSDDTDEEVAMVLRAMSCGVPVVATATGCLADVVADGVTGLRVPRAGGLPEALRSLLSDPMRRQSMGLAAVDRVRARFDTHVVSGTLERLLLDVTTGRVAAAS
jgi:hypothetical protein